MSSVNEFVESTCKYFSKTELRIFITVQYGKSIRYAGYAPLYDEIVYDGTPEEGVFVVIFLPILPSVQELTVALLNTNYYASKSSLSITLCI